jgi:hypothetical protein
VLLILKKLLLLNTYTSERKEFFKMMTMVSMLEAVLVSNLWIDMVTAKIPVLCLSMAILIRSNANVDMALLLLRMVKDYLIVNVDLTIMISNGIT